MKFILLISIKMPTIVSINIFEQYKYGTSESFTATKIFIFQHFIFDEQLKFHALLSMKKVLYNLWAWMSLACCLFHKYQKTSSTKIVFRVITLISVLISKKKKKKKISVLGGGKGALNI